MGTSGSSRGSRPNTPLVPSWLGDSPAGPLPGSDGPTGGNSDGGDTDSDGSDANTGGDGGNAPRGDLRPPAIPAAPPGPRFQSARRNFSTFAGSGGADRRALRRAVRDYVRSGTRGSTNATRRMGASRDTAGGVLSVLRGFQRDGVGATLQRLNLANLVGRPARDVFVGLTDAICKDGGSIDEGIARDAWLETVAEVDDLGIDDLDALSSDQMQEVFFAFIAHAIEARLFQEIGVNGLHLAADLAAIDAFEVQLKSYIRRSVRDSFSGDLKGLSVLSDQQIMDVVNQTFGEAWDLLEAWGDVRE